MLAASRERIAERLSPGDVVLDIGGWADPFERADWVIDLFPYETRGFYARQGWAEVRDREPERFTRATWIQRDVCDREPLPFDDDSIDFVICSHTLEDIRDPVWVCSEINRVGKAGYIEVPSRLEEQSWGCAGEFVGWSHHRWLIDVSDGEIAFAFKVHSIHAHEDQFFPPGFWSRLSEEERVHSLWWEGGFSYRERTFEDEEDTHRELRSFVERELARRGMSNATANARPREQHGPLRRLGALLRR
jgi:hypothetical protein